MVKLLSDNYNFEQLLTNVHVLSAKECVKLVKHHFTNTDNDNWKKELFNEKNCLNGKTDCIKLVIILKHMLPISWILDIDRC